MIHQEDTSLRGFTAGEVIERRAAGLGNNVKLDYAVPIVCNGIIQKPFILVS